MIEIASISTVVMSYPFYFVIQCLDASLFAFQFSLFHFFCPRFSSMKTRHGSSSVEYYKLYTSFRVVDSAVCIASIPIRGNCQVLSLYFHRSQLSNLP